MSNTKIQARVFTTQEPTRGVCAYLPTPRWPFSSASCRARVDGELMGLQRGEGVSLKRCGCVMGHLDAAAALNLTLGFYNSAPLGGLPILQVGKTEVCNGSGFS